MRYNVLVVAAALLGVTSLPIAAQVNVNMNQMTCKDWLGYSPESQNFVRYWMSGYYNAAANSNVLDYDRLQRNSAKILAHCKKHKSDTLPTAIKKAAS
jgi:HdeA/HdeB family